MNEKFRSVISDSSDDKVKVVYSWHGPKAPIWNTELPNILTMTSVAEGACGHMESRNFWTDDLENKIFRKAKDKYEIVPAQYITDDDKRPFLYPFALAWRVPFESYFIQNSGILEFSHMPNFLIHFTRIGNGYILLDHSVEAFMADSELDAMYSYFHGQYFLPMYKIIYLTGAVNAQQLYDQWAEKRNVPKDKYHRMTVIPYASSREIFNSYLHYGDHDGKPAVEPEYDTETIPPKLFLSWNRRFRSHRIYLGLLLEHLNLVDRSLVSFNKVDDERNTVTFMSKVTTMLQENNGECIWPYGSHDQNYQFTEATGVKFNSRLPLDIDGETDINKMCEDFGYTSEYYKQTLVSIVTETNFTANECTLTEKSFKPLLHKHPFIIFGVPGALQGLRDLGFQTFGQFWDESYDTTEDPGQRFIKIANIMKKIGSWNDHQILEFRRKVKPILDHNYNLLRTPGAKLIAEKIYNHITETFEKGEIHVTCNEQENCFRFHQ